MKWEHATAYNEEQEFAASDAHDLDQALLQVDFSENCENYTCVLCNEIQSAHWYQKQVSLFIAAMRHSVHSRVITSDNLIHFKDTLVSYIDSLLDDLPRTIKIVSF